MLDQSRFSMMAKFLPCFFSSVLLVGCSSMNIVPVSLNVSATPVINASEHEMSLPVRLRVYQLSDVNKFKDATFRELWKHDKKTLAETFIGVHEMTVTPKSQTKIKLDRAEKTKYIGVFALFRHPRLSTWRAYKSVSSQASSLLSSTSVTVSGNVVRIK